MTLMWVALLLILLSSWVSSIPAGAHTQLTLPTLVPVTIVAPPSGLVAIQGEGFSPGGLVTIAVYDGEGEDMRQHVWTVASAAVHGPNGSADPAQGYAAAGSIDEVIAIAPDTVYGPNGSQDPAQGYSGGDHARGGSTGSCSQDLIVRGYDQRTSTWSNPIDVIVSC
jgi:hypothetical protein